MTEFYQEARLTFYHRLEAEHHYVRDPRSRVLVAHVSVDYLGEVDYPGLIVLRMGVVHIGRSSHTTLTALFTGDRCAGLAKAVLVHTVDGNAVPMPEPLQEMLWKYSLPAELRDIVA